MANCFCGSNRDFDNCCNRFLLGKEKPRTAEELMRSRYSAFASKNVDYILCTEKLKRPNNKKDLTEWVNATTYVKLDILETTKGKAEDQTGTVTFTATFFINGQLDVMKEKSSFKRIKDDWIYIGTL